MSLDQYSHCSDKNDAKHVPAPDSNAAVNKMRDEVVNEQGPTRFHGLRLGPVAQIGFESNGSLRVHLNLGIVDAGVNVGLKNGADAGVHLGPIVDVGAGAFVGADRNGFHGNFGGRGSALGLVGAGAEANARLGDATGAEVAAGANVGDIRARAGAGAALGDDGLDAGVMGHARAGRLLGVHTGGHFGLGDDSELAVAGGGNIGDLRGTATTGLYTDQGTDFRGDIRLNGSAACHKGVLDLNPPIGYPDETSYRGASTSADAPPVSKPSLKDTPIESKPLPPAHEAATPENMARVSRESITKLCNDAKYTVHKGDTYDSIAAKLLPTADKDHQAAYAKKLQKMNEENGYKGLHNGLVLNTDDPYSLERKSKQMVAEHFGLQTQPAPPTAAAIQTPVTKGA